MITPTEDQMIEVYRKEAHHLNVVFSETAFNCAKAVSCLRLITIVRVSDRHIGCLCVLFVCVYFSIKEMYIPMCTCGVDILHFLVI